MCMCMCIFLCGYGVDRYGGSDQALVYDCVLCETYRKDIRNAIHDYVVMYMCLVMCMFRRCVFVCECDWLCVCVKIVIHVYRLVYRYID